MPSRPVLPLPRLATTWPFFAALAVIHLCLGVGHVGPLLEGAVTFTNVWKGFGALFGCYYFSALALRARR